jgi:hypothetical protein
MDYSFIIEEVLDQNKNSEENLYNGVYGERKSL